MKPSLPRHLMRSGLVTGLPSTAENSVPSSVTSWFSSYDVAAMTDGQLLSGQSFGGRTRSILVVIVRGANHPCDLLARDDRHVNITDDHIKACKSAWDVPSWLHLTHGYCPWSLRGPVGHPRHKYTGIPSS